MDAPSLLRQRSRNACGSSRKRANLRAALAIFFAYYNLVKFHGSVRMTPAMAAGVTRKPWGVGDLLDAVAA